jgi:hypothetical protein
MPFTVSHAAAVLPFRRSRLPWSALVIGSFGPDFEYFLRMHYVSRAWHFYPDALFYCLPFSLCAYFLFELFIRRPAIELLPQSFQERIDPRPPVFPRTIIQGSAVLGALILGIATHIFWDLLTHDSSSLTDRIAILGDRVNLPYLNHMYGYELAQTLSTVGGLLILGWFLWRWHRATPVSYPLLSNFSLLKKVAVWTTMFVLAAIGALWRVWNLLGHPRTSGHDSLLHLILIIAGIGWFLWELLAYGVFTTVWRKNKEAHR